LVVVASGGVVGDSRRGERSSEEKEEKRRSTQMGVSSSKRPFGALEKNEAELSSLREIHRAKQHGLPLLCRRRCQLENVKVESRGGKEEESESEDGDRGTAEFTKPLKRRTMLDGTRGSNAGAVAIRRVRRVYTDRERRRREATPGKGGKGIEGKRKMNVRHRCLLALPLRQLAIRSYDQIRCESGRRVKEQERLSLNRRETNERRKRRTDVQSPDPVATIPPTGETATEITEFL
jgi:hypothetical protein